MNSHCQSMCVQLFLRLQFALQLPCSDFVVTGLKLLLKVAYKIVSHPVSFKIVYMIVSHRIPF